MVLYTVSLSLSLSLIGDKYTYQHTLTCTDTGKHKYVTEYGTVLNTLLNTVLYTCNGSHFQTGRTTKIVIFGIVLK